MAEVVGVVSSIIAVLQLTGALVSVGYEYIGGVKSASKDLQDLVDELHSLGKVLVILQDHADKNLKSPALQELGCDEGPLRGCNEQLEILRLKLEAGKALGLKGKMRNLVWPLKASETAQHISRIERHKSLFTFALTADQITLSKAIEEYVENTNLIVQNLQVETAILAQEIGKYAQDTSLAVQKIDAHIQDTNSALQGLQDEFLAQESWRVADRNRKALSWLYPGKFDKKHTGISSRRQKDTGEWLLNSPQFKDWEKGLGSSKLLWGFGIPGAGKTFLTSRVIDHFEARAKSEGYGVGYIYFDYIEQDQQTAVEVLASLAKQLAPQLPQFPKDIGDLYRKRKKPTFDELYSAIVTSANSFVQVFLIFDALDECDQEKQREDLLPMFHRLRDDGINVFLTSRLHPEDIQDSFRDCMKIELSARDQDIQNYIADRISKNPRARRLIQQGKLGDKVISGLTESAQGMFLLVHFQIEAICKKTTPRQVLKELDNLKDSPERLLDHTYDRAMEDLRKEPDSCELALKVFSWLVRAGRALTLSEIRVAVSVEPDRYELDELDYPDPVTLLDVCRGLVVVDEETDTIRLAHYTVQEYLIQHAVISHAEFDLARACITYLSFDGLAKDQCKSSKSYISRLESFPLLQYAVNQLSFHLNACDQNLTTDLVLKFLGNSGCYLSYSQVTDMQYYRGIHGWYWDADRFNGSMLHFASSIGHLPVVLKLLEQATMEEISAQNHSGETPLHKAVYYKHEAVVKALLERGADLSVQTNWLETPLHYAARANEAILKLLIEKGADISARNSRGETALHAAASRKDGLEAVIWILLENGSDHSTPDERGETALHRAARAGNEAVVEILLENGADLSAQTRHGDTVFYTAATSSNWALVQTLLKRGADHSILNNIGETALHAAVSVMENEKMVEVLLENDVDISARKRNGETALYLAVSYSNEAVLQMLLKKGADHSIPDKEGNTALHCAALSGNVVIAKMLLGLGASVSAVNNCGVTPLHRAVSRGHKHIVQLLLERGADHSALDDEGKTPLDYGVIQEYNKPKFLDETIELLRGRGAISTQDTRGDLAQADTLESKQQG